MQDRFSDEDRYARHLLYLVPSIVVNNTLELSEATEGMLFWENELLFPKSLGNELRRWKTVSVSWEGTSKRSSTSTWCVWLGCFSKYSGIVFFSLHAPYQSVVRKLSGPFHSHEKDQNLHQIDNVWKRFSDLAAIAMHYPERFEVDEICEAFVKAHPRRLF